MRPFSLGLPIEVWFKSASYFSKEDMTEQYQFQINIGVDPDWRFCLQESTCIVGAWEQMDGWMIYRNQGIIGASTLLVRLGESLGFWQRLQGPFHQQEDPIRVVKIREASKG